MTLQASAAVAGPSRNTYPPPLIHLSSSRSDPPSSSSRASTPSVYGRSSTPSIYGGSSTPSAAYGYNKVNGRASTPSLYGRSSTPVLYPNGARFRSTSVISTTTAQTQSQRENEEFKKKRIDSVNKLKSTWELLKEKYGSINLEDDDEIDLRTGEVVKDRGRLREFQGRDFGEVSDTPEEEQEQEQEGSSIFGGTQDEEYEFDSDEDEIGAWDERSGLDPQMSDPPLLEEDDDPYEGSHEKSKKSWISEEDQDDLREFLRLEAERIELSGMNPLEEDEISSRSSSEPQHEVPLNLEEREKLLSPRLRGTRILPFPRLEDLFLSDEDLNEEREESSEDELQIIGGDTEDEIVHGPAESDENDDPFMDIPVAAPKISRRRQTVEVVIPIRPRRASLPAARNIPTPSQTTDQPLSKPIKSSVSAPSLADLFTSPPPEDDLCSIPSSPSPSASSSRCPSPLFDPLLAKSLSKSSSSSRHVSTDKPGSPSPSSRRSVSDASIPSTLVPQPRKSSVTAKGKERMVGERPREDTQPLPEPVESPYHVRLWKTRNGVNIICKRCKKAGGRRAEKAAWCKGRKGASECTFERDAIKQNGANENGQMDNTEDCAHIKSDKGPHSKNRVPTPLSEDEINATTDNVSTVASNGRHGGRAAKSCSLCKEAGGRREEDAKMCEGRTTSKSCPWYVGQQGKNARKSNAHPDSYQDLQPLRRTPSIPRRKSVPRRSMTRDISDTDNSPMVRKDNRSRPRRIIASKSDTESEAPPTSRTTPIRTPIRALSEYPDETPERPDGLDPDIYCSTLTFRPNGRARRCGLCHDAGGLRDERAWWCKGRAWSKFCYFLKNELHEPSTEDKAVEIESINQTNLDQQRKTPEASVRSSSVIRTKRKRNVSLNIGHNQTSSPTPISLQHNSSHMPSPPPTSSIEPYSPIQTTTARTDHRPSISFSMPPSSPPVHEPTNRSIHPTPSPSVSAVAINESPLNHKGPKPFKSAAGVSIGFGPTPPPSIDGARSSSLLSDNIPLTLPRPRKSILRKPSEGSSCPSSTGSVKRARFSLQPRSPIRMDSSDPLQREYDENQSSEDELSIDGNGNNHIQGIEYSSPFPNSSPAFNRYSTSSSSPLRIQWSVRAADIGIKLGPEHTGSLPKGMIKALTPSLSTSMSSLEGTGFISTSTASLLSATSKPTLGSSINHKFNLPTPPPSLGPSNSSVSKFGPRSGPSPALGNTGGNIDGSGNRKSSNIGLMLPPPVPLRKLTPAPTSSSSPSVPTLRKSTSDISLITTINTTPTLERSSSLIPSTTIILEKESELSVVSPIRFKSQPDSYIRSLGKSRSRSRSMSIQPTINIHTQTPMRKGFVREVSTTPRKKSRVELELAKMAQEVGDDAGLEWGLDEDTEDGGRMWREGSIVMLRSEM